MVREYCSCLWWRRRVVVGVVMVVGRWLLLQFLMVVSVEVKLLVFDCDYGGDRVVLVVGVDDGGSYRSCGNSGGGDVGLLMVLVMDVRGLLVSLSW